MSDGPQYPGPPGSPQNQPYGAPGQPYGAPPPGYPSPYGQPGYGPYSQRVRNSDAVTALVCGILGLVVCAPVGIAGIIYGNRAKREIAASGGTQEGEGMATAGVVLGWVALALMVIGVIFLITVFGFATRNSSP